MITGIIIGVAFMLCLIIAYAAGYGHADIKNKDTTTDDE